MAGFSDITGVSIKGGCYTDPNGQPSQLKHILEKPINILFGRNGSGKSTLARALYEYAHPNPNGNEFEVKFLDDDLYEDMRKRVFVYNEAFVEKNVKTQTDGLETILILGNKDIQRNQKIQRLDDELTQLRKERDQLDLAVKEHKDPSKAGVQQAYNNLVDVLKNKGYADRGRDIKGGKIKASVTEKTVDDVVTTYNNTIPNSNLKQQFDDELSKLRTLKSGNTILWSKPSTPTLFNPLQISTLLSKKVEQPELSEREKYLLELSQQGYTYVNSLKNDIIAHHRGICPLCLQNIDDKQHTTLEDAVSHILSKAVDEHKDELARTIASLHDYQPALPMLPDNIFGNDLKVAQDVISQINQLIEEVKNMLQQKINNPLNPLVGDYEMMLQDAMKQLDNAWSKLDDDVDQYNKSVKERDKLEKHLHRLNTELAVMEHGMLISTYIARKTDYEDKKVKLQDKENKIRDAEVKLDQLKAADSDAGRAVNLINSYLFSIFDDGNRLTLTFDEKSNNYRLKTRGNDVMPRRVSEGERNIIGLAYFFAMLNAGRNLNDIYKDPMLLIIDDPISSYDYGNRVGVVTFINTQIRNMLKGNNESKVVLMSHDMQTIQRFASIYPSIIRDSFDRRDENMTTYQVYELACGKVLMRKDVENGGEYKRLMGLVFKYANSTNPEEVTDISIGNDMRRVLEAYCTFIYGRGIDYLDTAIGSALYSKDGRNDRKIMYYTSLIKKAYLNAESHLKCDLLDNQYELSMTYEEKRKAARDILVIMKIINYKHVESCMTDKGNMRIIGEWQRAIESRLNE